MANERQARVVAEGRSAATHLLTAWRDLQVARDAYDANGGQPAFAAYLSTQEVSSDEFYALMVFCNELDTFMTLARKVSLLKVRG